MTTRGTMKMLGTTITPSVLAQLDAVRGEIPRSRIVERALQRFLLDLQDGKLSLIEKEKGTTEKDG